MKEYKVFGERELEGWSDKNIVNSYVARFGPVTDEAAREMVARISASGASILDLCCGQGSLTAMLTEAGAHVTGLDFSPEMLAIAARTAPDAILQEGDAAAMPFDDDSFDAVLCNFGMMHIPDQPRALSEIARTLKPGGKFLMGTWAGPDVSPAFGTVFGALKALADFSLAPEQPDLFAFARPETAAQMMADAGLAMSAHEMVTPTWEFEEAEELFDIFLNGTVGAAMLIKSQKPAVIEAIRDKISTDVSEKFKTGTNYRVPVTIAIVTAVAQ